MKTDMRAKDNTMKLNYIQDSRHIGVILLIALQVACNRRVTDIDTNVASPPPKATTAAPKSPPPESRVEKDKAVPSSRPGPGCGRHAPFGEQVLSFGQKSTPYFVTLPKAYDKNRPTPVVYVFHGYNRTYNQMREIDAEGLDDALGSWAVAVYPMAVNGLGWHTTSEENEDGMQMFEALHRRVQDEYCIDPDRVFATGLSSGGYFSGSLACRKGDILRGVGIVSGAVEYRQNCLGQVAAVVIHGKQDKVVPTAHGLQARDYFATVNGCGEKTVPGPCPPCVKYQGCDKDYPLEWCTHDEPTYENTNHGWPSFASKVINLFFKELKPPSPPKSGNNL
jgi:poly(3-hydroxybutyrate) depolymerase